MPFERNTVKSHFKALDLYNFIRGFGWAYKRGGGGLISRGLISEIKKNVSERDKTYLRNELKLACHYILSYIFYSETGTTGTEQNESKKTRSLNVFNLSV